MAAAHATFAAESATCTIPSHATFAEMDEIFQVTDTSIISSPKSGRFFKKNSISYPEWPAHNAIAVSRDLGS
ncbi:hypothetical protein OXX79_003106 [Metschnikowia pulcherrima]